MKKKNRYAGDLQEDFDVLAAHDIHIAQLEKYHYRIDGHLDVWPTTGKSYDIRSHKKSTFSELAPFILEETNHKCV